MNQSPRHRGRQSEVAVSPEEVATHRRSRSGSRSREFHEDGSKHKKHKKKRRHRDSSPSVSTASRRHAKKTHRKQKKTKHSKKKSHKKSRRRERSRSGSPAQSETASCPPGAHELASALTKLFDSYPAMASLDEGGIPLIFVQLSRGTEFNLSAMPDRNLAKLLSDVFQSLALHGMELTGSGAWGWLTTSSANANKGRDSLALLRLVRAMLGALGITLGAFEEHDRKLAMRQNQNKEELQTKQREPDNDFQNRSTEMRTEIGHEESSSDLVHRKRVERMTSQLLARFEPHSSSSSALALELQGICRLVSDGESLQLDGLENEKLKASLGQLFELVGLEIVEIEQEEDDDDEGVVAADGDPPKSYGYSLPDVSDSRSKAISNLEVVLRVCQFQSGNGVECAPLAWAASDNKSQAESSSDEEEDGPAPIGTMAAVKASKRVRHPAVATLISGTEETEGGREEWMTTPGEHDLLKGILSKSIRSRTFKNEKNRGLPVPSPACANQPINPEVLAEVNAIHQAYEESRGPSLLDAHRQQQEELKRQQQGQKAHEWKWSRDKNLDDGRRVDKNALHLVLGGAKTELKTKFQGGHGH
ncbi:hypothetical protein HJC23_005570 [Cyclotella cryptica]|uniref:Uncharacterized protein n=1 Tax=Cyclotella cryptica TaxID=29204 RepID=A0ABD3Q2Z0_9STRA|eukprot:CCRYP_010660-RA/>CCRYP_010660-RA protein AED:0.41 eAED:0.41 QI:0/-1/0/1/-1/1/1/0/589